MYTYIVHLHLKFFTLTPDTYLTHCGATLRTHTSHAHFARVTDTNGMGMTALDLATKVKRERRRVSR